MGVIKGDTRSLDYGSRVRNVRFDAGAFTGEDWYAE